MNIEPTSKQYVEVEVWSDEDPTVKQVQMAFVDLAATNPVHTYINGDWKGSEQSGSRWRSTARALVGPGTSAVLEAGHQYEVLVKIISNPEVPVLPSGYVTVDES